MQEVGLAGTSPQWWEGKYVRITKGQRKESVCRVIATRKTINGCIDVQLHIPSKRKFWLSIDNVSVLDNYDGPCYLVIRDIKEGVTDIMNNQIKVGDIVSFPRVVNNSLDLVIGVVSEITQNDVVYIEPKISSGHIPSRKRVRVGKPSSIMVLNSITTEVLHKINTTVV